MKKYVPTFFLAVSLVGCQGQSADNVATEKRIAVCQEIMRDYIKEAKIPERDHKRLVGTCHMSQKERTLEQWQCTLADMKQGVKYAEATDKCTKTGATR